LIAPALITWILVKVSGVPMVEHRMKRKRLGYDGVTNWEEIARGAGYAAVFSFDDLEDFTTGIDEMVWYQKSVHRMLTDTWSHRILNEHRRRLKRFLSVARALTR